MASPPAPGAMGFRVGEVAERIAGAALGQRQVSLLGGDIGRHDQQERIFGQQTQRQLRSAERVGVLTQLSAGAGAPLVTPPST